jgi:glycosyltransferase involved in cell wall biosynthesis
MKSNSSVTGLIIAFNHKRFLGLAIESMIAQSLQPREIIVIVNKSQDSTLSVANAYKKIHKNINVIDLHQNIGPSNSWNLGVKSSNSEYVAVSSGDDISLSTRLEFQKELLENSNKSVVANLVQLIDKSGRLINSAWGGSEFFDCSPTLLYENLFWNQNFINGSAVCVRKSEYSEMNPFYLQLHDFDSWLKVSRRSKVLVSPEILVNYRVLDDSLSHKSENGSKIDLERTNTELQQIYISSLLSLNDSKIEMLLKIYKLQLGQIKKKPNKITAIVILLFTHKNPIIRNLGRRVLMANVNGVDSELISNLFNFEHSELWQNLYPEIKND